MTRLLNTPIIGPNVEIVRADLRDARSLAGVCDGATSVFHAAGLVHPNKVQELYDVNVGGEPRKVIGHFGRNGFFYTLDRANGSFIKGGQYVNDLNWTKGLDPKTGKPVEYDPKLDVQIYAPEARALRGDPMKRACPTWHGGVAHQPTAYNPVKQIAYGVGAEGCFSQNGAEFKFRGPDGGLDARACAVDKAQKDQAQQTSRD